MLAVIQPKIPGLVPLLGTVEELKRIESHIPEPRDEYLVKFGTTGAPTSVAGVLSYLPSISFAHFGCHGSQNLTRPLDSALHLEDGDLKISEIIKCRMPRASLAYLSACETAKGDTSSPDEALHIAATMVFAGFRGVVGTMWQVHFVLNKTNLQRIICFLRQVN